jgi:hypothetical protein
MVLTMLSLAAKLFVYQTHTGGMTGPDAGARWNVNGCGDHGGGDGVTGVRGRRFPAKVVPIGGSPGGSRRVEALGAAVDVRAGKGSSQQILLLRTCCV